MAVFLLIGRPVSKPAASNPVAPTMNLLREKSPDGAQPVESPVTRLRVSKALAAAAHALLEAANAIAGTSGAYPSDPVTPICQNGHSGFSDFLPDDLTVRELVNQFLIAKARAVRSDRYLRQLRVSLSSFSRGRANVPVASVTLPEVEQWAFSLGATKTMSGYLGDVKTLFNFAVKRGYLRANCANGVELPADLTKLNPPQIHTPEEVSQVLEWARKANLNVMRHLAIRYFAGVRSAEAFRLREENILTEQGYIEIPAKVAKTRRRRLIPIQPNLALWLALGGELVPMGATTVRELIVCSGVKWSKNVTRHSFCSYHLSEFSNAGKTAIEAGHTETMLFGHYREIVTKAQAKAYWAIVPTS